MKVVCVLASAANNNAAICEHTSPMPAIHVQWANKTSPFCLVATHTLRGAADSLCECLTKAKNIKNFGLAI